jgi:prevent-host-death family protein
MNTATAREVQHGFGRYLERASRGESVIITKHGRKMARLVPLAADDADPLPAWPDFAARMKKHFPDGPPPGPSPGELIDEARKERF